MKPYIIDEYAHISNCIMVYPENLKLIDNYSKFSTYIDKNLMLEQYNSYINVLETLNVNIDFLELSGEPNQVFARDIGFVINNILFISKMTNPIRKSETDNLKNYIKKMNIDNVHFMENEIEGGDVLVHNNLIFIGIGERTTPRAVDELKKILNKHNLNYEIIEIVIDKSLIHLDCAFNILDKDTCIITKGVYNPESIIDKFKSIIKVPDDEVSSLAANIVCLGNKEVLCSNEKFSNILKERGYKTTYIPFTEIIKAEGSLGCCIFPTKRNH